MSNIGALNGIQVLDLSRLLPGPYCSMILADHGADVLVLEDKRYLKDGHYIEILNRNKRHMNLNLKTDKGREIFFKLAAKADVILEGFRRGVVRKLGVHYEAVRKINPKIVYCSITGYGQTGPNCNKAGHDVNYLSISGVLDLIGEPHQKPVIPGVQVADVVGAMNGAMGILLALRAREQTGQGQFVDVSITDSAIGFLSVPLFLSHISGAAFRRGDNMLSHRYACYNTYETADGRYLSVGIVEPSFWRKLCEKLEVPEYIALQYDEKRREEILQTFQEKFKARPLREWEVELADLDACCEPVRTMEEALHDPVFLNRQAVVSLQNSAGGKTQAPGVPIRLSATPGGVRSQPAAFGENTWDILRELGYSDEMIGDLESEDTI